MNTKLFLLCILCMHHTPHWATEKAPSDQNNAAASSLSTQDQQELGALAQQFPSGIQRLMMAYLGKYLIIPEDIDYTDHCSNYKDRYIAANSGGTYTVYLPSISRLSFQSGSWQGTYLVVNKEVPFHDTRALTAEFASHDRADSCLRVQYSLPHHYVARDENDLPRELQAPYSPLCALLVPKEVPYAITADSQFMAYVSDFKKDKGGVKVRIVQCAVDPHYMALKQFFTAPDAKEEDAFPTNHFATLRAQLKLLENDGLCKKSDDTSNATQ